MGRLGYVPSLLCAEFAMGRVVPSVEIMHQSFVTTAPLGSGK